jgi:hypothetical protein
MRLACLFLLWFPVSAAWAGELKTFEGGASCGLKKGVDKQWVDADPSEVPGGLYSTTPSQITPGSLLFKHKGSAFRADASCFADIPKKTKKKKDEAKSVFMLSVHGFASYLRGKQADGFVLEDTGSKTTAAIMNPKPGTRARLGFGRSEDLLFFVQYTRWVGEQRYDRDISLGAYTGRYSGSHIATNQSLDLGGMFTFRALPWDWIKTYCQLGVGYFQIDSNFDFDYPFAFKAQGDNFAFNVGVGAIIPLFGIPGLFIDLNLDFTYADVSKLKVYEADLSVRVGEEYDDRQIDYQRLGMNAGLRFQF